ncbi:MAG: hypothetical protein LBB48_02470 [Treponema sp.]|jgi:hypothetical protein|nr:hypothetical protein [Treponema sp.]
MVELISKTALVFPAFKRFNDGIRHDGQAEEFHGVVFVRGMNRVGEGTVERFPCQRVYETPFREYADSNKAGGLYLGRNVRDGGFGAFD